MATLFGIMGFADVKVFVDVCVSMFVCLRENESVM